MLMLMLYVDVSLDCCFEGAVCCTISVAIRKVLMLWVLDVDVDVVC